MTLPLLALAVAPGLAIAIYIYWRDKYEREPLGLLTKCFLLGASTILPAILIEGVAISFLGLGDSVFGYFHNSRLFTSG